MKPTDALNQTLTLGFMAAHSHRRQRYVGPGTVVGAMPVEVREALGRLTSSELANVRVEPWELQGDEWVAKQRIRKLLQDFDAKATKFDPGFSNT